VVLTIRPDIGAVSLATVFGLFSIVSGISALVLAAQTRWHTDRRTAGGLHHMNDTKRPAHRLREPAAATRWSVARPVALVH
jgi:hypothetical protein